MNDERKRFEAWYASDAYPMMRPIGWHTNGFRQSHSEYWVGEIQEEWLTWQAAEAQAVRRCAEIVDAMALDKNVKWEFRAGIDRASYAIRAEFPEAFKC